ncbi:acetolactate synthase 2 small subunit [Aliikangiella sp. G2MR2-5]|uniref:acetolactate synthase 2 small subunit n=1 Tax=Aliikangiella sp. G2MR2-5 TaxID=2788943 RepID=UPI0018AB2C63|nr:acetolactate synthase 2 small subunit [Aliikangiella sp. G2MR2-5]
MKCHLLKIRANNEPATMEQLLRVVRFRGFKVDKISMSILPQEHVMDVQVSVKSLRPIHLLENQLKKLVDVNQVFVEQATAAQASVQ